MLSNHYIGILGGMGYRATVLAYEKLNQLYEQKKGPGYSCPIRLTSIDFKEINELLPDKTQAAAEKLLPALQDMDRQAVIVNIMINNTLHEAFDRLDDRLSLKKPFGHIGKLLQDSLREKRPGRVMVLGTTYTMNSGYFARYIPPDVEIVKPEARLQRQLEDLRLIYFHSQNPVIAEACYRQLTASCICVDTFIVACTEHSLAFAPLMKDTQWLNTANWIDTMDLQCAFAIQHLLANEVDV